MRNLIQEHGFAFSMTLMLLIILCAVVGYYYINTQKKKDNLLKHRGFIEMIPSFISTLGVLGTFAGITIGLYFFDTKDLTTSIPLLLNGLKTAFFTSLAGMVGSLLLSGKVNRLYDKKSGGVSDAAEAASLIVKAMEDLKRLTDKQTQIQTPFYNSAQTAIQSISTAISNIDNTIQGIDDKCKKLYLGVGGVGVAAKNIDNKQTNIESFTESLRQNVIVIKETQKSLEQKTDTLLRYMNDINGKQTSVVGNTESMVQSLGSINEKQASIEGKTESIVLSVGNIEETEKGILTQATEQSGHVGEMLDHTEALVSGQDVISGHVAQFGEKLHGEIVEIEDKMSETNQLLTSKFEEFAELLRKSNTEALVEVMKKVTQEFQKQMNALISKLVQENFDQLNKSVERLNTWQQENKAMIQSLTNQYKQMAENFENTSTSLSRVDEDTRHLVSEGGKLHQIVNALNAVIVEDEKFIKISSDLQSTANLTKTNYDQFDEATKRLNDWVKKQRNFVDGVTVLIQKLDELNKIRDYGEQFWKETRNSMNEGVGIIKGGTDELNKQVAGLNNQFYARLSTTLVQLDNCIQALITKAEKK